MDQVSQRGSSPAKPQYSVTSEFGGQQDVGPFLIPQSAQDGNDIRVFVTGPVSQNAAAGPIALPNVKMPAPLPTNQSVFTANIVDPGGGAPLAAIQVNIASATAWSADTADRATLLAAFKVLRAQIEALETIASPPITTGSAEQIINRVASQLPLSYDEILPFFYGFDIANQTIDVDAGMALQISWASYQYASSPGGPLEGYNGFATTGLTVLDVVRRIDTTLAFDVFSGSFVPGVQLQPPSPPPPPHSPILAGGPVDLQLGGNARRHFKLIWPPTFPASNATEAPGSISLSCQLVGADTYEDLATAVANILSDQSGSIQQSNGKYTVVIEFTGRVTVVPCLRSWIDTMPQILAVGTTLRNAIERFAEPGSYQMTNTGIGPTPLSVGLYRWVQNNDPPAPPGPHDDTYMLGKIDLTDADLAVGPCGDGLDLPLIKGDALTMLKQENPYGIWS